MKIAFVADDSETISSHFGRASQVVVITVEGGQEVAREIRTKEGHGKDQHGHGMNHDHSHEPRRHEHHNHDHTNKFTPMQDCDVMVVRGIGSPAIAHAESMGLEVYATREKTIDAALAAYLAGELDHDTRRIHHH